MDDLALGEALQGSRLLAQRQGVEAVVAAIANTSCQRDLRMKRCKSMADCLLSSPRQVIGQPGGGVRAGQPVAGLHGHAAAVGDGSDAAAREAARSRGAGRQGAHRQGHFDWWFGDGTQQRVGTTELKQSSACAAKFRRAERVGMRTAYGEMQDPLREALTFLPFIGFLVLQGT